VKISAVLFDLDGTLLDMDLDSFLVRYFAALESALAPLASDIDVISAVQRSTMTMMGEHAGRSNSDVFWEDFEARTSRSHGDLKEAADRFYRDGFPLLGDSYGPMPGAREAVEQARSAGMRVALATNPIFPRAAVDARLAWAGLEPALFDHVTSYESATTCKPMPAYFAETAAALGAACEECLMVGDDHDLDLPAAQTGMRVWCVKASDGRPADGSLLDLAAEFRAMGS